MGFKADVEFDLMTPEVLKAYLKPCITIISIFFIKIFFTITNFVLQYKMHIIFF